MNIRVAFVALTLLAFGAGSISCGPKVGDADEVAVLETSYGRIVIEFLPRVAPRHVANFKELAREGLYDGTKFHRIMSDKNRRVVIQGGDPNSINGDPATWGPGQPGQKKVAAEFSSVRHQRGIVSAARKREDPNSATSQFFICLTSEPSFDGQYSVFGRVIEGMNVVDAIGNAPVVPKTERPIDPVVLEKVYLVKRGELK